MFFTGSAFEGERSVLGWCLQPGGMYLSTAPWEVVLPRTDYIPLYGCAVNHDDLIKKQNDSSLRYHFQLLDH